MIQRRLGLAGSVSGCWLLIGTGAMAVQDRIARVSVDSSGAEADDFSGDGGLSISADGRHVAFDSYATNLVPSDNNQFCDVFVHDRITRATVRVSVGSSGAEGDHASANPSLSSDGRFVAFASFATNLVSSDTNGCTDVFVHDRDPDGNGIFDDGNGVTTRVSVDSNGAQADNWSDRPSIAGDGSIVAFYALADNLVAGDRNGFEDVFVHDLATGSTTRVSVASNGTEGNLSSWLPCISADGKVVAFSSWAANLVANDGPCSDVFVHDRETNTTSIVSVDSSGANADLDSFGSSISSDGSIVAFESNSDNLVSDDTNGLSDVFAHDRTSGATTRESVDSAGREGNGPSYWASLSASGQVVSFGSSSDNLVENDTNSTYDIFRHDRLSGQTTLLTTTCSGAPADEWSSLPKVSADGSVIEFLSGATNLVVGDTDGFQDVFVYDETIPEIDASWGNYGAGYPGTLGIPNLTASAPPVFGTTITIDVGNSRGAATIGFLLVGLDQASIPTSAGGTILVDFVFMIPLAIGASGLSIPATIPHDDQLCGLSIYVQALESDPGAAHKTAFTPGLLLTIGH